MEKVKNNFDDTKTNVTYENGDIKNYVKYFDKLCSVIVSTWSNSPPFLKYGTLDGIITIWKYGLPADLMFAVSPSIFSK